MTRVQYGNTVFYNCLTRTWDQEVQYDESGTDLLFVRHRITVEGIAHLGALQGDRDDQICWIGPDTIFTGKLPDLVTFLRTQLSMPRLVLQISVGGEVVLEVAPAHDPPGRSPYRDADNGPKPKLLSFTRLIGDTVHVAWQVEVAVPSDCVEPLARQQGGGIVISNRWSIEEQLDDKFFTTRTIRGRLRISHPTVPAESARQIVVPPLEQGFRRDSIQFTVSANGLDCDFEVTDKQVHTAAPSPAVRMDVTHTEVTNDGINWITDLNIRLEGAPHTPKKQLVTRALQIVLDRMLWAKFIPRSGEDQDQGWIPQQIALVDHIGDENVIELKFRIQRVFEDLASRLLAIKYSFGRPLTLPYPVGRGGLAPYDPRLSPVPAIWGYDSQGQLRRPAAVIALACYLQHPCDMYHGYQVAGTPQQVRETRSKDRSDKPTVKGYEAEELPEYSPGEVSDIARKILYTRAAAETRYYEETLRVGLPLALLPGTGSSSEPRPVTTRWIELAKGAQARLTIRWEIERVGSWPETPEPKAEVTWETNRGSVGLYLIRHHQDFLAPTPAKDASKKIYAIEARLEYGLERPLERGETLRVAYLPTVKFSPRDRQVDRSELYDETLDV